MANAFATNFAVPSSTNVFQLIWKLTRVMKKAGWTVTASSDGTTKDTTGVASADKWGGNADPSADTYPPNSLRDTTAGWIVMSGPQTVKIPLSAAPTGIFLRGEFVTQATSTATGQLLGYVWDAVGSSGYAVIMPHTGTFNNSNIVTGSLSAATFTPTGTVVVYKREIVFAKQAASTVNGQIFYICADAAAEAAQLFSAIAATATTTVAIAPGALGTTVNGGTLGLSTTPITVTVATAGTTGFPASGTFTVNIPGAPVTVTYTGIGGSTTFTGCTIASGTATMATGYSVSNFPLKGVCVRGTTTLQTTAAAASWLNHNTTGFVATNNGQIACVNATPSAGVTADGSFYVVASNIAVEAGLVSGFMFTALDDTEPGDVDPYAFVHPLAETLATWTNQSSTSTSNSTFIVRNNFDNATKAGFIGYAARGCPVVARDLPTIWGGSLYGTTLVTGYTSVVGNQIVTRVLNHPATTPPVVIMEPFLLHNASLAAQLAPRQVKGKTRWMRITGRGNTYDTYENKTWLAVAYMYTSNQMAIVFGPYDGVTIPLR